MQPEVGSNGGIIHSLGLGAMRVIMHSLRLGIIDSLKLGIMHNQQWE
jgi:hypothetical protein